MTAHDPSDGWSALLADMEATRRELDADGWKTIAIPAGDTAAETSDSGRDRFGFTHVVPGDEADRFADSFDPDGYPTTRVFHRLSGDRLYLLTAVLDPDRSTAILLAGAVDRNALAACRREALEAGRMYTHVQRVDGTHLGSFVHEDPDAFFPSLD